MERTDFSLLEKQIFDLKYNGLRISDFEQWVYNTPDLQTLLVSEDYLSLISLNYKNKHVMSELERILDKYVDYGKFEMAKVDSLLRKALNKDNNIGMILRQFYELYCDGYYFFEDLGLGYGLACEVPLKYANTWEELSEEQKSEIINSFYPQLESDIKRALDWIENRKIVLTGAKDNMNRWEYLDNRTPEEKKSSVWVKVDSKSEISAKECILNIKEQKKWWQFWK